MKKVIAIVFCVTFMLSLLIACAPPTAPGATQPDQATPAPASTPSDDGGDDEGADVPDELEAIELRYWAYSRWQGLTGLEPDGEFGDWQREQARIFMEQNTHITIEFEHLPWASGPERVSVAIATGTQPDVLEDGMLRGFGYAAQGVLLDFDDALTPEERADIMDDAWDLVQWTDGRHYGMPWGNMAVFGLANLDIFRAAGAENLLPSNPERTWTFDELEAALAAVSNPSEGLYGTAFFAGNEQGDTVTMSFLRGFGANLLSSDLQAATLNSPEAVEFAEFALRMIENGYAMPGAETIQNADTNDFFNQQRIAVVFGQGTAHYANIRNAMERGEIDEFDIAFVMNPSQPGIDPSFNANVVAVLAFRSGNPAREQAAIDLAKFVTSGENARAVQHVSLLSTRYSTGDLYVGEEIMEFSSIVVRYAVDPGLGTPVWSQIRAVLFPAMQGIFSHSLTPVEAFEQFDTQVQELLDSN